MDERRRLDLQERYQAAMHAMQTGVAIWMGVDSGETEPKHLRVGINSALLDASALAKLLIAKGVFTDEEYALALIEMVEAEVERYRRLLEENYGAAVTLV